jgi:hypothetical protein
MVPVFPAVSKGSGRGKPRPSIVSGKMLYRGYVLLTQVKVGMVPMRDTHAMMP